MFIASSRNLFVNNLHIFWPSTILLITLDQLKSVRVKFHADWTKSQKGVRKSRFSSFCNFEKKLSRQMEAWPIVKWFSSIQEIWGYRCFWMCNIRCGSYRQKRVGLGYSAPCRRTYVVFSVWGTCRCLDQPSKLYCPPLHGLACSTTFSKRKIQIKIFTYYRVSSRVRVSTAEGMRMQEYTFPRPLGLAP